MNKWIIISLAVIAMANLAYSDCCHCTSKSCCRASCGFANGALGCCGKGPCNIFCCNCDDGCYYKTGCSDCRPSSGFHQVCSQSSGCECLERRRRSMLDELIKLSSPKPHQVEDSPSARKIMKGMFHGSLFSTEALKNICFQRLILMEICNWIYMRLPLF